MPTFLSKVFSRKKTDEKEATSKNKRASVHSLLEGKFEAVSPTVSPSANHFPETGQKVRGRAKDKGGLTLIRSRSRHKVSPGGSADKTSQAAPHLTLNLSGPKAEEAGGRPLDVVFETGTDGQVSLDDSVLGEKRLSPLEALLLVRACSQAISARGLETLGIMHPHWHSASPAAQRRLISLFILSLAPKAPITTISPTPTSPILAFESEINYSRSPHDVAAVLRWGLRHLQIDGESFGKANGSGFSWYDAFAESERKNSYPPKAFSELLVPELPPAHHEILLSTLETISSLAAHSEMNGESGSKLSMFLGYLLLTSHKTSRSEDWPAFYAEWERAGRILEHLFLSHIRDQAAKEKIPKRLMELINHYPYTKQAQGSLPDTVFPRPRFSTRSYDALYVRVHTELNSGDVQPLASDPVSIIEDALHSAAGETGEYQKLWEEVKKAGIASSEAQNGEDGVEQSTLLSNIFADETIRLLSLRSTDDVEKRSPVNITMFTNAPDRVANRRRSTSLGSHPNGNASGKTKEQLSDTPKRIKTSPSAPTTSGTRSADPPSPIIADWNMFSSSGFGETTNQSLAATLFDNEVEKTVPIPVSRRSSRKPKPSPKQSRRSSVDNPSPPIPPVPIKTRKAVSAVVSLVQLDEAFIDFWSDSLFDPITSSQPSFVICQLKSLPNLISNGKQITWLVIEQSYSTPSPVPEPVSPAHRASSPRPSLRSESTPDKRNSRVGSTFTATRKRFTFFGGHQETTVNNAGKEDLNKKPPKGPKIGEMGEVIQEEKPAPTAAASSPTPPTIAIPTPKKQKKVAQVTKDAEVPVSTVLATTGGAVVSDALPKTDEAMVAPAPSGQSIDDEVKNLKEGDQKLVDEATATIPNYQPVRPVSEANPPAPIAVLSAGETESPSVEPHVTKDAVPDDAMQSTEPDTQSLSVPTQTADPATSEPIIPASQEQQATIPGDEAIPPVVVAAEPTVPSHPVEESNETAAVPSPPGAGESRFIEHIPTSPDTLSAGQELTATDARTDTQPANDDKAQTELAPEEIGYGVVHKKVSLQEGADDTLEEPAQTLQDMTLPGEETSDHLTANKNTSPIEPSPPSHDILPTAEQFAADPEVVTTTAEGKELETAPAVHAAGEESVDATQESPANVEITATTPSKSEVQEPDVSLTHASEVDLTSVTGEPDKEFLAPVEHKSDQPESIEASSVETHHDEAANITPLTEDTVEKPPVGSSPVVNPALAPGIEGDSTLPLMETHEHLAVEQVPSLDPAADDSEISGVENNNPEMS